MKPRFHLCSAVAALALGLLSWPTDAQTPSRLYISADREGVAGAVSEQQLTPSGFEYARFREFMIAEVSTVIEAAAAAGVTEIVVSDSRDNGQNLLIEKFPK